MPSVMISAVRASLVTFVLCGLLYPLSLTGLAQLFLPFQANGSLERGADGVVIGSRLIGQQWNGPEWFHGRPSATTAADPSDPSKTLPAPYNAANSTGSNLGPTSKTLAERLMNDRGALERAQPELVGRLLPADMLTTSASGLDPDITPATAALQVARVARARGVPAGPIERLLEQHVTGRGLGIFGEPRVNVLALNLALQGALAPYATDSMSTALQRAHASK
jgi:potassium-transporting ATPase KdpC subunit